MNKVVHLADIEGIKDESVAFVSYVMNQYGPAPFEQLAFIEVNEPFMAAEATHVAAFGGFGHDEIHEFWIIEALGKPAGMAIRRVVAGKIDDDYTSFIQFVMRPYHKDCVVEAIGKLPIVKFDKEERRLELTRETTH